MLRKPVGYPLVPRRKKSWFKTQDSSTLPNLISSARRSITLSARPLIARLRTMPCDKCSRPIRAWDGRIWLIERERWVHSRCWKRRLFFRRDMESKANEIRGQIKAEQPEAREQQAEELTPRMRVEKNADEERSLSMTIDRGKTSSSSISTVTRISGKVEFRGLAKIEGEVEGEISGDDIEITSSAVVMARVTANRLKVGGQVEGEIIARERIELLPTARIRCAIITPKLVVMEGAQFDGECKIPRAAERSSQSA
jgi:cytoskeletal protein CcmA (bactofilin family)